MKKRLISLVLAAFMVLALVPVTVAAADTDVGVDNQFVMQFSVDKVTVGNDDQTVDVSISVDVNVGFAAMNYQLVFDKDVFVLNQQPRVNSEMGFEFVGGPLDMAANQGKHLGMLSSEENVYRNGVLVTYTFGIVPGAKAGTHVIRLITDGGNVELPGGGKIELEVIDDNFVNMTNVTNIAGGVTIPGYKVSYNANGGTGAPASQTKSKNDFVYVSSVIPERDGYRFLGWSTSASAHSAKYKAGDKYSEDADVTLYAVWEKLGDIAGTIDLAVEKVEAKAGDEIEVAISLANNTGLLDLQFALVFDDTKLKYLSSRQVSAPTSPGDEDEDPFELHMLDFSPPIASTVTNSGNFSFTLDLQYADQGFNRLGNGDLVYVKFKVLDEAEDGFTDISIVPDSANKIHGEAALPTPLEINVTNGGVEISSQLLGDVNLDGSVDLEDAILVLQHSLFPDDYPIEYRGGVDFTKNGSVDLDDAILLLQYSLFPEDYPIA